MCSRAARIERESKRREQEERARYQDDVIKKWLLEKKVIEKQRKHDVDRSGSLFAH